MIEFVKTYPQVFLSIVAGLGALNTSLLGFLGWFALQTLTKINKNQDELFKMCKQASDRLLILETAQKFQHPGVFQQSS